jgi:two-component system nitrogen regulation response regulator GlnG
MYKLIEAHSQIRRIEQIPIEEIRLKMAQTDNDVDECASRLKTPSEALRRHLRGLGLIKPI